MRKQSPTDPHRRREIALRRLAEGGSVTEVAGELGVTDRTVRKWRREVEVNPLLAAFFGSGVPAKQEMARSMRLWLFAVTKIMVEKALQDRDSKALDTVFKVLRDLDIAEGSDDGDGDTVGDRLERELSKVHPETAAEIVRILGKAKPAGARVDRIPDDATGGKGVGTLRLPWAEDDPAPDEGGDEV